MGNYALYIFLLLLNPTSRWIALNGSITFSYQIMFTCNRSITESLVSRVCAVKTNTVVNKSNTTPPVVDV